MKPSLIPHHFCSIPHQKMIFLLFVELITSLMRCYLELSWRQLEGITQFLPRKPILILDSSNDQKCFLLNKELYKHYYLHFTDNKLGLRDIIWLTQSHTAYVLQRKVLNSGLLTSRPMFFLLYYKIQRTHSVCHLPLTGTFLFVDLKDSTS